METPEEIDRRTKRLCEESDAVQRETERLLQRLGDERDENSE